MVCPSPGCVRPDGVLFSEPICFQDSPPPPLLSNQTRLIVIIVVCMLYATTTNLSVPRDTNRQAAVVPSVEMEPRRLVCLAPRSSLNQTAFNNVLDQPGEARAYVFFLRPTSVCHVARTTLLCTRTVAWHARPNNFSREGTQMKRRGSPDDWLSFRVYMIFVVLCTYVAADTVRDTKSDRKVVRTSYRRPWLCSLPFVRTT